MNKLILLASYLVCVLLSNNLDAGKMFYKYTVLEYHEPIHSIDYETVLNQPEGQEFQYRLGIILNNLHHDSVTDSGFKFSHTCCEEFGMPMYIDHYVQFDREDGSIFAVHDYFLVSIWFEDPSEMPECSPSEYTKLLMAIGYEKMLW